MPCTKALLSVFLNLRPTPFGLHKLSPFEIVAEHPMHLVPASFEPQLIKGNILEYSKGLIASIRNNHVLVEQSFPSVPLGNKDFRHHTLQPGDFVY